MSSEKLGGLRLIPYQSTRTDFLHNRRRLLGHFKGYSLFSSQKTAGGGVRKLPSAFLCHLGRQSELAFHSLCGVKSSFNLV